jgi:hypothetical protein
MAKKISRNYKRASGETREKKEEIITYCLWCNIGMTNTAGIKRIREEDESGNLTGRFKYKCTLEDAGEKCAILSIYRILGANEEAICIPGIREVPRAHEIYRYSKMANGIKKAAEKNRGRNASE